MRRRWLTMLFAVGLGTPAGVGCALDWDRLDPRRPSLPGGGGADATTTSTSGGAGGQGGAVAACGDGARSDSEQCDDGNLDEGDGCSDDCRVECNGLLEPTELHCYAVSDVEVSEPEAADACRQRGEGWTLAAISSSEEMAWLSEQDAINEVFAQSPFIWLGGSDAATEGSFSWINGETPFPMALFIPGQPDNNGDEDCVDFWRTTTGDYGLNDDRCSRAFPHLCERPPTGR